MDWIETTIRIFGIFGFEVGSISIQIIKGGRGGGQAFPYEATRGIFVPSSCSWPGVAVKLCRAKAGMGRAIKETLISSR